MCFLFMRHWLLRTRDVSPYSLVKQNVLSVYSCSNVKYIYVSSSMLEIIYKDHLMAKDRN